MINTSIQGNGLVLVSKGTHQDWLIGALYEFRKIVVDDITN